MTFIPICKMKYIKDAAIEMLMPVKEWLHTTTADNGKTLTPNEAIKQLINN